MAFKTELTGATRYRVATRFFKKSLVVLQVEERVQGDTICNDGMRTPFIDTTQWRDATVEDITGKLKELA